MKHAKLLYIVGILLLVVNLILFINQWNNVAKSQEISKTIPLYVPGNFQGIQDNYLSYNEKYIVITYRNSKGYYDIVFYDIQSGNILKVFEVTPDRRARTWEDIKPQPSGY